MLLDRDIPKGVENLKLQVEIFGNKQTNNRNKRTEKQNAQKEKRDTKTLIGRMSKWHLFFVSMQQHIPCGTGTCWCVLADTTRL